MNKKGHTLCHPSQLTFDIGVWPSLSHRPQMTMTCCPSPADSMGSLLAYDVLSVPS